MKEEKCQNQPTCRHNSNYVFVVVLYILLVIIIGSIIY